MTHPQLNLLLLIIGTVGNYCSLQWLIPKLTKGKFRLAVKEWYLRWFTSQVLCLALLFLSTQIDVLIGDFVSPIPALFICCLAANLLIFAIAGRYLPQNIKIADFKSLAVGCLVLTIVLCVGVSVLGVVQAFI